MICEICGKEINPEQPCIAEGLDENGNPTEATKFYHAWCLAIQNKASFTWEKDGEIIAQVKEGEPIKLPEEG
ncbi:hypothetical protein H5T88_07915 [bacterium]|nr:hypothetical protein [bacterium]